MCPFFVLMIYKSALLPGTVSFFTKLIFQDIDFIISVWAILIFYYNLRFPNKIFHET